MPEDLMEGLYLTGVGMGVVFLALFGLLLIMLALQRLFPGEGPAPAAQEGREEKAPGKGPIPPERLEPPRATDSQSHGGIPGLQIAAIAVATYLAMEQEEELQQAPGTTPASTLSPSHGVWSAQGRTSSLGSQGHRPPPYGRKAHSAYSSRVGLS